MFKYLQGGACGRVTTVTSPALQAASLTARPNLFTLQRNNVDISNSVHYQHPLTAPAEARSVSDVTN